MIGARPFRPAMAARVARLADAVAESAMAAAVVAFAWPLVLAVPLLAGPAIALGAGLAAYAFASAIGRRPLAAANDNTPWPPHRVRAVGHRPASTRRDACPRRDPTIDAPAAGGA